MTEKNPQALPLAVPVVFRLEVRSSSDIYASTVPIKYMKKLSNKRDFILLTRTIFFCRYRTAFGKFETCNGECHGNCDMADESVTLCSSSVQ